MFDLPKMSERERRAYNRGLEHAARLALLHAEEHWSRSHDNLLSDNILMGLVKPGTMADEKKKSERLQIEGYGIVSRAHEAQDIARAIRKLKASRTKARGITK